jgi:hypothetical protein
MIKGEITVDVAVNPRVIAMGPLGKGEEAAKPFSIVVTDAEKHKVSEVTVADDNFKIKFVEGDQKGNAKYELQYNGKGEIGRISTTINVTYEGPGAQPVQAHVRINVVGDLEYSKNLYFTKRNDVFGPKEIKIVSRSGKNVAIKGIDNPDKKVTLKIVEKAGKEAKIEATVTDVDASYKQHARGSFYILTNSKDQDKLEVKYMISERRSPRTNVPGKPINIKPMTTTAPTIVKPNVKKAE